MHGPVHILAALVVCCCLAMLAGCAETAEHTSGLISSVFHKKTPEQILNIKTPDDRVKELRKLAKAAKKKTPEEQERIVTELAKEIQQENDPFLRRQILRTLAVYPPPLAAAVITAGLADSDTETRRVACTCLGIRGGKDSVQELTRVMASDTNLDVRLAAVRAMGHTHDSSAMPPLAESLIDPDPAVQALARGSLKAVSGRDYGNNVQAWREYAQSGETTAPEVSLAERMRRAFY
jgi:HEAT repeat protein